MKSPIVSHVGQVAEIDIHKLLKRLCLAATTLARLSKANDACTCRPEALPLGIHPSQNFTPQNTSKDACHRIFCRSQIVKSIYLLLTRDKL